MVKSNFEKKGGEEPSPHSPPPLPPVPTPMHLLTVNFML